MGNSHLSSYLPELDMLQTTLPAARFFDGWMRLPVSRERVLQYTILDIESELWSALEYYSEVEEVGLNLIQTKGIQPQSLHEVFKYFQAFVRQAKSYYISAKSLHYRSNSLLYYYSFLNLGKAYLLLKDPQRIMGRTKLSVAHGLSYRSSTTNTDFQLESVRVCDGIFPMFYEAQIGIAISTAKTSTLNIVKLLGYPSDISSQYGLVGYGNCKIISSLAAVVTDLTRNQSWTIIGIPARTDLDDFLRLQVNFLNSYQEVEINRNRLIPIFGMGAPELSRFRFFQEIVTTPLSFGGIIFSGAHIDNIIGTLEPYFGIHYYDDNSDFDLALPYLDIAHSTPIPMNEVLAIYAVMFYLSSLVRYRPNYLEALLNYKPAWLIENFVNTVPEVFLRMMVSKITEKDFIYRRR